MVKDGVARDAERVQPFPDLAKSRACALAEPVVHAPGGVASLRHLPERMRCVRSKMQRPEAAGLAATDRIPAKIVMQVDVVNGFKIKRHDPYYRVVLGKIYQYTSKFLFSLPIEDVDCDFRLIRRSIFDRFELTSNSGTICVEMIHKISMAWKIPADLLVQPYDLVRRTSALVGEAGLEPAKP